MKICSKCKQSKDDSEFYRRPDGRLLSHCKTCQNKYTRNHYENNKDQYLDRNDRKKDDLSYLVMKYLVEHSCVDCGESDPLVLDFDHVRGEKEKEVTTLRRYGSLERIQEEISKCEIRCANCHRKRHAGEKKKSLLEKILTERG